MFRTTFCSRICLNFERISKKKNIFFVRQCNRMHAEKSFICLQNESKFYPLVMRKIKIFHRKTCTYERPTLCKLLIRSNAINCLKVARYIFFNQTFCKFSEKHRLCTIYGCRLVHLKTATN